MISFTSYPFSFRVKQANAFTYDTFFYYNIAYHFYEKLDCFERSVSSGRRAGCCVFYCANKREFT